MSWSDQAQSTSTVYEDTDPGLFPVVSNSRATSVQYCTGDREKKGRDTPTTNKKRGERRNNLGKGSVQIKRVTLSLSRIFTMAIIIGICSVYFV